MKISNEFPCSISLPAKTFALPKVSLFNLKFFIILGTTLIGFLLAFYIFQISSVVSVSYQIQENKQKINELSQENEILEINSSQIGSLTNIENKIQELGFEKIEEIYYVKVPETPIVTKK